MERPSKKFQSLEEKQQLSDKLIKQNPNYVPLEVFKSKNCTIDCFDRKNFLVPCSFPFYLLIEDIRKKIGSMDKRQALFCFVQSSLVKSDTTVGELYTKHKNADGFLYVEFSDINAYG